MKTTFFIISLLMLHYPLGVFKDTLRRYTRMKHYGKEEQYEIMNGIMPFDQGNPIFNFEGFYLAVIGAFILAIFPAFQIFDFHWVIIILINVLIPVLISPALAFFTTLPLSIKHRNQVTKLTYQCVLIGFLLSIIGIFL